MELTLGHRHWQQQFWGAHSTMKTLVLAAPFWNPPSSILVPGLGTAHHSGHQYWDNSGQGAYRAGTHSHRPAGQLP